MPLFELYFSIKFGSKIANFCLKIEISILRRNRFFGQKSKYWYKIQLFFKSKIEIFIDNRNFCPSSKFFIKNLFFFTKIDFFVSKTEIFIVNRKFSRKSKFLSKIENRLLYQIDFFFKKRRFFQNFESKCYGQASY